MTNYKLPLLTVLIAVAITTTMDFTGYTVFSALPLLGITLLFWLIQRQSKAEIGLIIGAPKYYGLALLYPALVLGLTAFIAYLSGDFSVEGTVWANKLRNIAAGSTIGIIMVLLTKEGFFRGWLWNKTNSLEKQPD